MHNVVKLFLKKVLLLATIYSREIFVIFKSQLKFIYSEKATKVCKISTLLLSVCTVDKSKVEISQNFVAFSECTNFKIHEKKECSFRIDVIAFYISRETFGFYTHFHSCLQDAQRKMFIDHKSRSHDNYKKSLFSSASFFNYGANHLTLFPLLQSWFLPENICFLAQGTQQAFSFEYHKLKDEIIELEQ